MLLWILNTLCVLISCTVTLIGVFKHLKNYRKPMDQRLIVRILMMVPLFSITAYLRLYSPIKYPVKALEFVREIYEAVVIYTFYTLLTNLLGGEREIIYETTGKAPVHFFGIKLDISDPHTFWIIKKLVMQYVYSRPIITVLMSINRSRVLNVLLTIAYNISITLALNALMAFWLCLKTELEPYRVVLKFLSVKMIVFFSYWQTLALSIVRSLNWISSDSLVVLSNSLMCWETVLFAYIHWRAFPSSDYRATFMFGFARMRLSAAFRDAFGIVDILCDFRSTFLESRYGHRNFDSVEAVLDHPDSKTRRKRINAGLRYRNGGRSKYWLPDSSLKKLLTRGSRTSYGAVSSSSSHASNDGGQPQDNDNGDRYGNFVDEEEDLRSSPSSAENELNAEDEHSDGEEELYRIARQSYGDYNYPVATVRESEEYVSFEDRLRRRQILDGI